MVTLSHFLTFSHHLRQISSNCCSQDFFSWSSKYVKTRLRPRRPCHSTKGRRTSRSLVPHLCCAALPCSRRRGPFLTVLDSSRWRSRCHVLLFFCVRALKPWTLHGFVRLYSSLVLLLQTSITEALIQSVLLPLRRPMLCKKRPTQQELGLQGICKTSRL